MFRQGSLRDERRRRALVEDAMAAGAEAPTSMKPARKVVARNGESYSELARTEHQWRVTDLIPRRSWGLVGWFVAGVATVALLEAGYWLAITRPVANVPLPTALDLAARGSLAGYTSALVLLGAAALSILIYAVRRHRIDDYRGRYRVWAWAAMLWCLASIDAVADLRSLVRVLCVALTGHTGPGGGVAWWLAPWLLALFFVALRTALDMRPSRLALVSFLLTLGCWTAALVLDGARFSLDDMQAIMLARGLSLGGDWLLFWSCMAFGRYVMLEAHGELPLRSSRPKKEARKSAQKRDDLSGPELTATKSAPAANVRVDTPHAAPTKTAIPSAGASAVKWGANTQAPVARSNASAATATGARAAVSPSTIQPSQARAQFVNGSHGDSQPSHTLSRAERKRLRREQRARDHDE